MSRIASTLRWLSEGKPIRTDRLRGTSQGVGKPIGHHDPGDGNRRFKPSRPDQSYALPLRWSMIFLRPDERSAEPEGESQSDMYLYALQSPA